MTGWCLCFDVYAHVCQTFEIVEMTPEQDVRNHVVQLLNNPVLKAKFQNGQSPPHLLCWFSRF